MTCPQCSKPMTVAPAKMFVCEPCREIVLLFKITKPFKPPRR